LAFSKNKLQTTQNTYYFVVGDNALKSNNNYFDLSSNYIDKLEKYLLLSDLENKIYIPSYEVDCIIPTKENKLQHNINAEEGLKKFDHRVNLFISIIRNNIKIAFESKDSTEKKSNLIILSQTLDGIKNYVEKTIDEKLKI